MGRCLTRRLAPSIKNNLAELISRQKRDVESKDLLHQIKEENPDYPFARLSLARLALAEKRRFHHSEFAGWIKAQIELAMALQQPWQAYTWFESMRKELPQDAEINAWKMRVFLGGLQAP